MAYRITAIWFLSILSIFSLNVGHAQKTVGLIDYQPGEVTKGYNLIFPHNQPNVYLLDNCGQVVHRWEDEDDYRPGNSVYLLENGNLVKCKRHVSGVVDPIWAGGGGAVVEILDWDNNLLWSFEQNDSLRRLHHDVEVLPNGNIIMISWEKKTFEEAIQAGRDTALMTHDELWPDYLLEVDPNTDSIVWEWHVWDHLIQDHDPTKDNFGVIRDHPELVNVNFVMGEGVPDWMHSNYVDYNPELDQIMFSVNFFSEVWIIDHSTSTEEAAGHSGGRSGRGGDLLYRWGNPMAYDRGNELDQRLFSQHDTRWLDDFVDQSHPDFGKILLFNNRFHPDYSAAHVIRPAFDTANWEYPRELSNRWGPNTYDRTILHPDTFPLHSTGLSSVQALPDQHWLLFSGRFGNAFELNEFLEVVWEYKVPFRAGQSVMQGDTLTINENITFAMRRYYPDYPAFQDKDLEAQGFLELNPDGTPCDQILPVFEDDQRYLKSYPNPVSSNEFTVEWQHATQKDAVICDLLGTPVMSLIIRPGENRVIIPQVEAGIYVLLIDGITQRLIVLN